VAGFNILKENYRDMNKIITILVTIFILLLLYIWISHVWGSDNPRHPRQIVDARESEILGADDTSSDMDTSLLTDAEMENEDYTTDDYSETEDQTETPGPAEIVESEPVKEEIKVEERPVAPKTEPKKPAAKPVTNTTPPATKTSQPIEKPVTVTTPADGKHMVIVGNFLQRVNAEQRMQELKKAGIGDVEIVNFDLSEYHTVSAGRFDDINEARKLVRKL